MKKRKLRSFVLPTLYLLITISIFVGVIFLGRDISLINKDYNYGVDALEDNVESVVVEDTVTTSEISSPVDLQKVPVAIHFYSKAADEVTQQNSLIFYENTYLPNTGVLYASEEDFEVKNVFAGKVTDILDDEFFGKCIVIEHNSNLRTYYYGLKDITVKVGDELNNNTIIGVSNNNKVINDKKSFLLEVYHNNTLINPENFIGTKITDYN